MHQHAADRADRLYDPALYDGIIVKRILAYLIDAVILAAVGFGLVMIGIMSFGLLLPLIWPVLPIIPLAYHTLTVGAAGSAIQSCRYWARTCRISPSRPSATSFRASPIAGTRR